MRILKLFIVTLLAGSAFFLAGCSDSKNHIVSFMHANINCSDLELSRSFYEMLGFTPVVEGNTEATAEFAAALDMPPYELRFVQMFSKDGSLIDLIEWEDPYDASAPYASINHLGIAHLALRTSYLDADISILRAHGVAFFSGPAVVDNSLASKRFVCFKDPDGTIIELAETAGFGATIDSNIHITGIIMHSTGMKRRAELDAPGTQGVCSPPLSFHNGRCVRPSHDENNDPKRVNPAQNTQF